MPALTTHPTQRHFGSVQPQDVHSHQCAALQSAYETGSTFSTRAAPHRAPAPHADPRVGRDRLSRHRAEGQSPLADENLLCLTASGRGNGVDRRVLLLVVLDAGEPGVERCLRHQRVLRVLAPAGPGRVPVAVHVDVVRSRLPGRQVASEIDPAPGRAHREPRPAHRQVDRRGGAGPAPSGSAGPTAARRPGTRSASPRRRRRWSGSRRRRGSNLPSCTVSPRRWLVARDALALNPEMIPRRHRACQEFCV